MTIVNRTAKSLSAKHDLFACGNGIKMDEKITYLSIEFHVFRPLNIDEARIMLFDCINTFLKNINSSEKLKNQLEDYPFTQNNVGITFYITGKEYTDLYPPNICLAKWTPTGVRFLTNDPDHKYRYKDRFEETHEEALALVKKYRAEYPQKTIN